MTRADAVARAHARFDDGGFRTELARLVSTRTESRNPDHRASLRAYLAEAIAPRLTAMGFACEIIEHPSGRGIFLIGERLEDARLPTVLGYGHGDTVPGMEGRWRDGLDPFALTDRDGVWYGRGVADNKGQHAVNLAAMEAVFAARGGRLGFNAKWLVEMGEEDGSPGLHEVAAQHKDRLAADLLIASDGPRLALERPTIFLGARGAFPIDIWVEARPGAHHSGNFGGLLANPAVELAHAIAAIVGSNGEIRVEAWRPKAVPDAVREALARLEVVEGRDGPALDPWWGEPGLTPAARVYGWPAFEIIALDCGDPRRPVNAIPGRAWARGQLRFTVDIDAGDILPGLRRHLDALGHTRVQVAQAREELFTATRLDPGHAAVRFALASVERTTGTAPALLPNLGGSLPNDVFAEILGLPTVWVPHSYPGCSQHAPDEHLPSGLLREALGIMAGLYWDLGEGDLAAGLLRRAP